MKKLIIMAAFAASAIGAQASVVKWGLEGSVDTTKFASGTAYLICTGTLAKPTTLTDDASAATWYKANGSSLSENAYRSASVSAGAVYETETIEEAVGNKQYWLLIVNKDESELAVSTLTKRLNITTGALTTEATWLASSQMSTYSLTNVPEPTSAMLLLLGFAGLALKRKRA